MSDIFLSYASEDRERVRPLVEALEGHGWSVWWDREITAGMTWPQMIETALESCGATVVVWTEASIASEWVQIEASEARERGKLVPVLLDDVKPPLEFRRVQAADLTTWDGRADSSDLRSVFAGLESVPGTPQTNPRKDASAESIRASAPSSHDVSGVPAGSTVLYSTVTQHWPKVALGFVSAAVLAGLAPVNLITGTSFQSYVFAWAAMTGGVWFLFDKAEASMSAQSRKDVVGWTRGDFGPSIATIPHRFALLFDQVFGDRHLSLKCFSRSALASVASALLVLLLFASGFAGQFSERVIALGEPGSVTVLLAVAMANVALDYLSLLETRLAIRWVHAPRGDSAWVHHIAGSFSLSGLSPDWVRTVGGAQGAQRTVTALIADFCVTYFGSALFWAVAMAELGDMGIPSAVLPTIVVVGILSSFFTSVWLWLYAASVLLSRVLLKMNKGVGFLLRVTDVENQPFRSMGFVSVLIVSGLFLMGLPFVLL